MQLYFKIEALISAPQIRMYIIVYQYKTILSNENLIDCVKRYYPNPRSVEATY